MLDPRLYRAALAPVVLAVLVAAFSLENRPRPIGTTLAPDAFDGRRATQTLDALAEQFPRRRAGDAADAALARRISAQLTRALAPTRGTTAFRPVRYERFRGRTLDGERDLVNVVATRVGAPGPGLVVVAHRDAAAPVSKAELSGTAALLELARVAGQGRLRRTVTFISTTGGSGGMAGARHAARRLARQPAGVDAVLVLGDLAGERVRKPFVVGWSNGRGQAPLRLRRTVDAAVRAEAGTDPGGPRASGQWTHLAAPLTIGEQGEFGRAGLPAVLLQVSGERGPDAAQPLAPGRLEAFGRAALRSLIALDNGPVVGGGPEELVVTQRKVLPLWAVRLLIGVLLLAPLLAAVDGFARLRRRRQRVGRWLRWTATAALPFALTGAFLLGLGATGLVTAPGAPLPERVVDVDGAAQAALAGAVLVFALGWLVLRPLALRLADARGRPGEPGAAMGVLLVFLAMAAVVWAANPFAAALLVPAAHLWLLAFAPGARLPRAAGVGLVVLSAAPVALVAAAHLDALGLGPLDGAWFGALLVAGGHAGAPAWAVWSVIAGCFVSAALVAAHRQPQRPAGGREDITVRGPSTYAGPGSLGGTESALRR